MSAPTFTRLLASTLALILWITPGSALAQQPNYPARPIRMIVPYPPGGGTDLTARTLAQHLSEVLGQPVLIDNQPGATGMIGAAAVVKSAPDGYTVLFGAASEMAINASLYKKMAYDPRADLEPVGLVALFPLVLVASAGSSDSLSALLDTARRKPGTVSYGSIGHGSPQHLAGELLANLTRSSLVHVPYKGSGPLVQDAVGGHLALAISSVPPAVPLVKAGRLRALAVTSLKRSSALPQVPTMAELGYAGYEFNTWVGMAVPVGTPKAVIARLNEALQKALALREVQQALRDQGAEPSPSTSEAFRQFIREEIARSDRIVSQAGIHLD